MVFCSKCGTEIKDEQDEFCSRCGTKIKKSVKEDKPISSSNKKKDWCPKCGKEFPYGQGEWPPGFPKICPNCGSEVKYPSNPSPTTPTKQSSDLPLPPISHGLPWGLLIVFITSIAVAVSTGTFDITYFILIFLLGGIAIYLLYTQETHRYHYIKYLAYFLIIVGVFYFLGGLAYDTSQEASLDRVIDTAQSGQVYIPSGTESAYLAAQRAYDQNYKIGLITNGPLITTFGILLLREVRNRSITG